MAITALCALFRWLTNEEILPPAWRNPMPKVKPPKVNLEPLEPISLEDVRALLETCERNMMLGHVKMLAKGVVCWDMPGE